MEFYFLSGLVAIVLLNVRRTLAQDTSVFNREHSTYGYTCVGSQRACRPGGSDGCPEGYFCAGTDGQMCCRGGLGPCQYLMATEVIGTNIADDTPSCRADGYHEAMHSSWVGVSYCMTPEGKQIPDTLTEEWMQEPDCLEYYRCPYPTQDPVKPCPSHGQCGEGEYCYNHRACCRGSRGPCVSLAERVDLQDGVPGRYYHQCKPDGSCKPVQCDFLLGECWCSTPNCQEMPRTRRPTLRQGHQGYRTQLERCHRMLNSRDRFGIRNYEEADLNL